MKRKRKKTRKIEASASEPRRRPAVMPAGEPLFKGFPDREMSAIFLVAKAVIVAALLLAFYGFEELHAVNLWNRWHSGTDVLDAFYLPFANWDGQHYALLADRGYPGHPHSHAFFPLYPLAVRAVQLVLGDVYVSGFVLNLLLSFLFCHVFHRYAVHFLPARDASGALALLLCYPTAFYLTVLYSEALFLLLLFAFLYFHDLRKSYLSALFALLLPLARGQAVFVLAAVLIVVAVERFKGKPIDYRYEACNVAAFAVGAVLYLGFFHAVVGDAFSGIRAQGSFVFGNSLANILNPGHFLAYLVAGAQGVFGYTHSLVDKIFVVASLSSIAIVAGTRNVRWLVLYVMLLYPVAAMGAGGSFSRFSLVAAPILALSVWTLYGAHRRIIHGAAAVLLAVQVFFAGRFALNLWVA